MASKRPLSPHIQVYDMLQMSSLTSALHRLTGLFLTLGVVVLCFWIVALLSLGTAFEILTTFFSSWMGKICLFVWTLFFFYHLCNGIRHLAWHLGKGFELSSVYRSGWLVFAGTILLTLGAWFLALGI